MQKINILHWYQSIEMELWGCNTEKKKRYFIFKKKEEDFLEGFEVICGNMQILEK